MMIGIRSVAMVLIGTAIAICPQVSELGKLQSLNSPALNTY